MEVVYRDDIERLSEAFTKENVLKSIEENGTFTLTYRLLMDDKPVYVNMKAVRMGNDPSHIIIGVNNVDAQMRQQEALERLQEEKLTYDRIVALSMDLIAVYSVDPETDNFIEYGATRDYDGLGFAKYGKDFFKTSLEESSRTICKDDLPLFKHMFNKEIILREIEDIGMFVLNYRLMINDEPTYVSLKATMVDEEGKPQLIVGISNIDLQMRRALEFDNFKKEFVNFTIFELRNKLKSIDENSKQEFFEKTKEFYYFLGLDSDEINNIPFEYFMHFIFIVNSDNFQEFIKKE